MGLAVEQYTEAALFLDKALGLLEQREAENNLILGIALSMKDKQAPEGTLFLSAFKKSAPVFCAVQTPPQNIIISAGENFPEEAIPAVCGFLGDAGISLPGVIGPVRMAEKFAACWSGENGMKYSPGMRLRGHRLDKVAPVKFPEGMFRLAGEMDAARIGQWLFDFTCEATTDEITYEEAMGTAAYQIHGGKSFVWEVNGTPVSLAVASRSTRNGACVSAVYTPRALRGKGYATACVAKLSVHLLTAGNKFCVLFTDLANPVSNHIYYKIGYRPAEDVNVYLFR